MANAVWLIYEGTIYPDIHFAINNEFDKTHRHCDAFLSLQLNPRLVWTWAHKDTDVEKMERSDVVEALSPSPVTSPPCPVL